MELVRTLGHQEAKAMTLATRHGNAYYFYGSTGEVYTLRPGDPRDGDITIQCSCPDYEYRRAARGEDCKHGAALRQQLSFSFP